MSIADLVPYAQIGGTFAAALGLLLNAWQFSRSRRTAALQQIQDFYKSTTERELALANANGDERKLRHAFIEFLNFLEVYAAAINGKMFFGIAREIVSDKLIDSIVVLEGSRQWHDEIEKSITSVVTYKHLRLFITQHRRTIISRTSIANAPH